MDPMFQALSYFRRRKYDKCIERCTSLLEKNPYDQAAWSLKMQALTEQVYVDDIEMDEQGIAEMLMDDNNIANVARPGTSLRTPNTAQGGLSQAVRPTSQGRPLSGFVRPGSQSGRPGTMEQAIRTPRNSQTARPVTSASGRFVRLGTASMLANPDGPFVNLSRLNFNKYAMRQNLAKALFEYILYHENDVRHALELAAFSTEAVQFRDYWWKMQLGKCYFRLGLFRDAEAQYRSALKLQEHVVIYLHLGQVYQRLDQPLAAIETYKQGLEKFPDNVSLLVAIGRMYEGMGDMEQSISFYKQVLKVDSMHIESIACIATHYFYNDQPEVALKFYRRLLQLGVQNAELFTNLGLCCFYSQQYDMCMTCFDRALSMATKENIADVCYNLAHVALGVGDTNLAYQNFRLALSHNNDHAEAYNNLGVLEVKRGNIEMGRAFFQAATSINPAMFESHYNYATLAERLGDLQTSYQAAKRSLDNFPNHADTKDLIKSLDEHFSTL